MNRVAMSSVVLVLSCCSCRQSEESRTTATQIPLERGVASWYGEKHHGRLTASGAIFDMNKLTAAHRTHTFGTQLRVRDVSTGKTVDVEVNDRGPFVKQRIIDLSRAGGTALDLAQRGTAQVELIVLGKPATRADPVFAVQIAMLPDQKQAESMRGDMQSEFGSAALVRYDSDPVLWRVLVGREQSVALAEALSRQIGVADSVVVLLDPE
jgi:rare lipoprotein A